MAIELNDRLLGKDGTYRKVLSIEGDVVTVRVGLSPETQKMSKADLDNWSADSLPGKPKKSDSQLQAQTSITITPIKG